VASEIGPEIASQELPGNRSVLGGESEMGCVPELGCVLAGSDFAFLRF